MYSGPINKGVVNACVNLHAYQNHIHVSSPITNVETPLGRNAILPKKKKPPQKSGLLSASTQNLLFVLTTKSSADTNKIPAYTFRAQLPFFIALEHVSNACLA